MSSKTSRRGEKNHLYDLHVPATPPDTYLYDLHVPAPPPDTLVLLENFHPNDSPFTSLREAGWGCEIQFHGAEVGEFTEPVRGIRIANDGRRGMLNF